ncbi:bacteriohemerythrin [Sulfurimonas sp.]|uniref:bacteriohemerythrin n=1 Tax=Sulfurimonas sp. TaxID=2022749 RepID=UPI0025E2CD2B|nr:bacteriohemerythrin [Sulfurimonas sp.]
MINWNDGLSIGVKEVDDDHKKLLNIINNLSIAISNNETNNIIDNIFNELKEYTKIHFQREETFLKNHNHPRIKKHIHEHKTFIEKIPELKTKLTNSLNTEHAQEVSYFLTDWLFNHIIEEDIPATNIFLNSAISNQNRSEKSILKKIIDKTTKTFSFTKRIFIFSIIPLLGMLIIGFIIIFNDYSNYKDIKKTSTLTQVITNINELAHTLQIERGLSSGYLSSSQTKFKENLNKQRSITLKSIESFNNKLLSVNSDKLLVITPFIKTFQKDINTLNDFRKKIDANEVSQNTAINFYTDIIKNILGITSKMAMFNLDKDISSSISSFYSLLQYKEALGLKRAYGTAIIENKDITKKKEYIKFIQLLGSQNTLLNNFNHTATSFQKDELNKIISSDISSTIYNLENSIKNHNLKDINSLLWFKSMTQLINNIKRFEDVLLYEINILIQNRLENGTNNLFTWIFYTSIIFILTVIIIYIFEQSSRNEMSQLIDAMKYLSHGDRTLKLSHVNTNDEMSKMYEAYEITRQKLLRGDIYAQLYLSKKELEIKKHQKQNLKLEEMASIDSLTGVLNRRKFAEISALELQRSSRYKSNLSFLMLDIDHFKNINDTYGHAVGDEILKHFASICLEMIRTLDVVARVGGEEFIIMLPETTGEDAYQFAERFREKIYSSEVNIKENLIKYSVSIGIAVLDEDNEVKDILHRADKALYKAKKSGRNCTIIDK